VRGLRSKPIDPMRLSLFTKPGDELSKRARVEMKSTRTAMHAESFPRPGKIIVTNKTLCRGCGLCELACSLVCEGSCNPSLSRIHVLKNHEQYVFRLFICPQCAVPYCMLPCPEGAIRVEGGVRVIVEELCTGCGLCAEACPFNQDQSVIFPHPRKEVYVKCDLCFWREEGPACIDVCPTRALTLKELKVVKK
jgi:Fe-S-cluster-containing hydrogenase component 2